ncbi:glycoside hydrolase [Rhizopogon salebrosus TDB-379]|nr:glycoside hydrolase [Rhizopogon salebrosus TDB-379]
MPKLALTSYTLLLVLILRANSRTTDLVCLTFALFYCSSCDPIITKGPDPLGIDVANHQGNVDCSTWKSKGGTTYTNPYFSSQYTGATNAGLIRGRYHFAHPDSSTGAMQASGWSADVIYTTTDRRTTCTGNSATFASTSPLWIAHPGSYIETLPAGWSMSDNTDLDRFNDDSTGLKRLALGS